MKKAKSAKKIPLKLKPKRKSQAKTTIRMEELQQKAKKAMELLAQEFPEPECALHHETPEQLLFATILSAQCTDARVNVVTPVLFEKYPSSRELAKANPADVEKIIHSTGFFKNKAKSLLACAQKIQSTFKGELPRTIEELTSLAGVGRKTANVLLGNAFGIEAGVVVDTHVTRLSNLIGFSQQKTAEKIEQDLMKIIPQETWTKFSHWMILHGRKTCIARKPKCAECVIRMHCDYGKKERI